MALGATVRKLSLAVADMDREHYETYDRTLAQHPSENDQRLMLRVLAMAMFAHPDLEFGRGVSTDDEPDLWQHELNGVITRWVDLGLPDERRLRKASSRSDQVVVLAYGASKADAWLNRVQGQFHRFASLQVWMVSNPDCDALAGMIGRSMRMSVSVQDGQYLFSDDARSVTVSPELIYG